VRPSRFGIEGNGLRKRIAAVSAEVFGARRSSAKALEVEACAPFVSAPRWGAPGAFSAGVARQPMPSTEFDNASFSACWAARPLASRGHGEGRHAQAGAAMRNEPREGEAVQAPRGRKKEGRLIQPAFLEVAELRLSFDQRRPAM
jgi:hypothetical protein